MYRAASIFVTSSLIVVLIPGMLLAQTPPIFDPIGPGISPQELGLLGYGELFPFPSGPPPVPNFQPPPERTVPIGRLHADVDVVAVRGGRPVRETLRSGEYYEAIANHSTFVVANVRGEYVAIPKKLLQIHN